MIVSGVFNVLAILVVLARLRARYLKQNSAIDDVLIVVSLVSDSPGNKGVRGTKLLQILTTGLVVSVCLAEKLYGYGQHTWDLGVDVLLSARKASTSYNGQDCTFMTLTLSYRSPSPMSCCTYGHRH